MIGSNSQRQKTALELALEKAIEKSGEPPTFPEGEVPVAPTKKSKKPSPPPALRVVQDEPASAATPEPPVTVSSSPVVETPPPVIETVPVPTATTMSALSFEDMGKLAQLKGILPAGSEVKLPSGISVRLTETGVEMITTATPAPVVIEKQVTLPATANDGFDDALSLLNPFADEEGKKQMVAAGEAARKRREEEDKARAKREEASRAARQERVAHTREVLGARLPELIRNRKGAKPLADFRDKTSGKVDMGALAKALGNLCAITGRAQRPGGGHILLIGEWGFMVDSEFDRDTAISLAKAEERKMRQIAAEEKEAEAVAALVEKIRQSGKLVQAPLEDDKDLLPLPTFQKGDIARLDWGKVTSGLRGTSDPLTGEKVERPGAFLLRFPEDKEGEEATKAAGLRLLSGFSRRLLEANANLLPTGMQLVKVDALSERVNFLIDAVTSGELDSPKPAKKHRRGTGGGPPRGPKKGPSTEVHMRPLSPAEKRAPEPPPKPTTRKVGKRK